MEKVVLVRCESYDYDEVKKAVEKGIKLLGGIKKLIKKNEKVLIKPNMLANDPAEKGTATHPMVFKVLAEIIKKASDNVSYGDSPAVASPESAALSTGIAFAAEELKIPLADFVNGKEVVYEKGIQNKKFFIANGVLESGCIISMPKLKTHGAQVFTGCIKNQFGCIPGLRKAEFHAKVQDPSAFARMLFDLNSFVNPRLYVMDGIISMEGNGPRGGDLRKTNVLLFSTDPAALDITACRIINLDPFQVPVLQHAQKLNNYEIETAGDKIENFFTKDFKVERPPEIMFFLKGFLKKIINLAVVRKPYIINEKCIKCGMCVNICPVKPKAVFFRKRENPPFYDYSRCISCYCCQEICPESAIELKVLSKILRKIIKI